MAQQVGGQVVGVSMGSPALFLGMKDRRAGPSQSESQRHGQRRLVEKPITGLARDNPKLCDDCARLFAPWIGFRILPSEAASQNIPQAK